MRNISSKSDQSKDLNSYSSFWAWITYILTLQTLDIKQKSSRKHKTPVCIPISLWCDLGFHLKLKWGSLGTFLSSNWVWSDLTQVEYDLRSSWALFETSLKSLAQALIDSWDILEADLRLSWDPLFYIYGWFEYTWIWFKFSLNLTWVWLDSNLSSLHIYLCTTWIHLLVPWWHHKQ